MSEAPVQIDDRELRLRGILALNETLGPVAALRFLSLIRRDPTDYVELSRQLFAGQTVDQIYARAASEWKE
jgi:hypothetical protein